MLDLALRGNVPSVFRESPEDSERRSSPAIGSIRGQARNYECKSWSQAAGPDNTQICEGSRTRSATAVASAGGRPDRML
jgi:hypothetical protein